MSYENKVSDHYTHGGLLESIEAAVIELGKTTDTVTIEDLAPVDEFHIGGRIATDNLLNQLNFSDKDHILDVGCGLGGSSRYVAKTLNNCVTGIDLTQEYVDVGNTLCTWVGLDKQITLQQGSALSMPFEDDTFDGAIMLHVGMNIGDKHKLFNETYRVLRPGAYFGMYDIMQIDSGDLAYPVPWAEESSTSMVSSPDEYKDALIQAGFKTSKENVRTDFAMDFFQQVLAKAKLVGGRPSIGLHILMQDSTAVKINNMINNVQAGLVAPVEIIAQK